MTPIFSGVKFLFFLFIFIFSILATGQLCHDRVISVVAERLDHMRKHVACTQGLLSHAQRLVMRVPRALSPGSLTLLCAVGCSITTSSIATQKTMSLYGTKNLYRNRNLKMGSNPLFFILYTSNPLPMYSIHYYYLYTIYIDNIARETPLIIH